MFLANMVAEQIVKRKKQTDYILKIKLLINSRLPFLNLSTKNVIPKVINGIKILINGKLNGRDRTKLIRILKYNTNFQIFKFFDSRFIKEYAFKQANSKYGSFGIKI